MTRLSLFRRSVLGAVAVASLCCAAAQAQGLAGPQSPGDISSRRLDRMERELNEVRQIVLQAHATGQPVEIKEAGPDPAVVALQKRIDDQDDQMRQLTGQIETLTHDLAVARKDLDGAETSLAALSARIDALEKQASGAAPPPPPPPPPSADQGAPAATPPATAGGAKDAYAHAHQLLMNGDYPAAADAFQGFIDSYGSSPSAPAARYWLGETKFIQNDYAGAATAYLAAIHGWPQTSWAPEAVAKLAQSLVELKKPTEACGALTELDRRYPKATPAAKTREAAVRQKAQCSG